MSRTSYGLRVKFAGKSVLVKHVEFSGNWLLWAHPHRGVGRQVINPEGGAIIEDNYFRGRPPADKEIMRQNSDAGPGPTGREIMFRNSKARGGTPGTSQPTASAPQFGITITAYANSHRSAVLHCALYSIALCDSVNYNSLLLYSTVVYKLLNYTATHS